MSNIDNSITRDKKMMKYLNPNVDFGFKKLFGENEDILIDFLNEVVDDTDKIKSIKYLNPEQLGHTEIDRKAVYDIYCTTDKGDYYIVEMQCVKQKYFIDRALFYSTFPIQKQIEKGKDFDFHFKRVIFIGLLDFVLNETDDIVKTEAILWDTVRNKSFSDVWKIIYLELPKFKKSLKELTTRYDKWLYLLTKLPQLQEMPLEFQDQIFTKVFKLAEVGAFTEAEYDTYFRSFKAYLDNYSAFKTAKDEGLAEGIKQGLTEGIKQGHEQGLSEGLELGEKKGFAEGIKQGQLTFAKYLLHQGKTLDEIQTITNLPFNELEKL